MTPVTQPAGADQAAVTLGNADGEIAGLTILESLTQAKVQSLRDGCEELAHDVRNLSTLTCHAVVPRPRGLRWVHSLRTALVAEGLIKGEA